MQDCGKHDSRMKPDNARRLLAAAKRSDWQTSKQPPRPVILTFWTCGNTLSHFHSPHRTYEHKHNYKQAALPPSLYTNSSSTTGCNCGRWKCNLLQSTHGKLCINALYTYQSTVLTALCTSTGLVRYKPKVTEDAHGVSFPFYHNNSKNK
jgi:hypothetical protein